MNNFEKWEEVFKKGWDIRVVENEHLFNLSFLQLISTVNPVKYVFGGKYKNANLSSFKIQQSGSGKGVADGYVSDILSRIGYKTCKLNSFTEAGVIGSAKMLPNGSVVSQPGALGEYDFIWVDEGRNLIIGNQWTQGLLETMNGYLDDGKVFKRLAKANIEYYSNCNFGTGSFFFEKLKLAVFATGFFQRCLFSYKYYPKEDIMRISKKFDDLADKDYVRDLLPMINELKDLKTQLNFEKYLKKKQRGDRIYKDYIIHMDLETSQKFGAMVDEYFTNEIVDQLGDKRLQDIILTFLIRCKELGHRIMCLYSVWNGEDSINNNSIDYAFNIVKNQLKSTLEFIGDTFEDTKFDNEDLGKESDKKRKKQFCERAIIHVIKNNPGITKTDFRKIIQIDKSKRIFYLGELKIIRNVLPDLIADGIIYELPGDLPAQKKMYVKENKNEKI